jgi:hypothetical protein
VKITNVLKRKRRKYVYMTLLLSPFCYSCLENAIIFINVLMLVGRNGDNWPFRRSLMSGGRVEVPRWQYQSTCLASLPHTVMKPNTAHDRRFVKDGCKQIDVYFRDLRDPKRSSSSPHITPSLVASSFLFHIAKLI